LSVREGHLEGLSLPQGGLHGLTNPLIEYLTGQIAALVSSVDNGGIIGGPLKFLALPLDGLKASFAPSSGLKASFRNRAGPLTGAEER